MREPNGPWRDAQGDRRLVVDGVEIAPAPARTRLALRCPVEETTRLAAVWPVPIPAAVGCGRQQAGHAALCLGPDEWMLFGPADRGADLAVSLAAGAALALTEVSDRSVGVVVTGPRAAELLCAATPFDVGSLSAGDATRVVFGRVEALVWRPTEADRFEVEVWRSYESYLWMLLEELVFEHAPAAP